VDAQHWVVGFGGALQVLGIALVALEAHRLRRTLRIRPTSPLWHWVRRALRWVLRRSGRRDLLQISAQGKASASGQATLQIRTVRGNGLAEDVDRLFSAVDRHEDAITRLEQRLSEESKERAQAMEDHAAAVGARLDAQRKLIQEVSGGDQWVRLQGVYAVAVDILLTTWPDWTVDVFVLLPWPLRVVFPLAALVLVCALP
jgi:hypothetical protein